MTNAKRKGYTFAISAAVLAATGGLGTPAHAANPEISGCTPITTAAQLQAMKNNLAGTYCLMKDIDAGSIANFTPVGDAGTKFTGQFYGNGHVIRNLTIANTTLPDVGMFGRVGNAVIQDVGLVNANISSTIAGYIGPLIGTLQPTTNKGATVQRAYSTGTVSCAVGVMNCFSGGLIGAGLNSVVSDSWSSATVSTGYGAGGFIGALAGDMVVRNSYATGDVTCKGAGCGGAGGFTTELFSDLIYNSYATGKVQSSAGFAGGFAALVMTGSGAANIYATGAVIGGANSTLGGLIGQNSGDLQACFAAGPVQGGAGATIGGLIGDVPGSPTVTDCYWDTDTSGQMTSSKGLGTGRTTAQLRNALPMGFTNGQWGLTKTKSYPFLNTDGFSSNLATVVRTGDIFTALPLVQTDKSQYIGNPAHANEASLATVYAMAARAIGQTLGVASLDNVKIDKYFWHDTTKTTTFSGPIATHSTLGAMTTIAANTPLNTSNVIGELNAQNWVVLRGTYKKAGGGTATHHMLATLYTKKGAAVALLIANDPLTGEQVAINPVTKQIVLPQDFPLIGFKVDGYAAISNFH